MAQRTRTLDRSGHSLSTSSTAPPAFVPGLSPGQALASYRIEGVLGQGGFGITYLARDVKLNNLVAIKEYLPLECSARNPDRSVGLSSPELAGRFEQGRSLFLDEARTLARFKHPNIVRVLAFFEENGTAYFVMEYEQGESLKSVLRRRKTFKEAEILGLALPLLDGLTALHAQGFIHRDIKPANIYLRQDSSPVLLDFGAARRSGAMQTPGGSTFLTPGYAPPEQYRLEGDEQGPWTDIYALGAVLFQMLSGRKPPDAFLRQSSVQSGQPDLLPAATSVGQGRFSAAFLGVLDRTLQLDPAARPTDATQLRTLLAPVAEALGLYLPRERQPLHGLLLEPAEPTPFPEMPPLPGPTPRAPVAPAPPPVVPAATAPGPDISHSVPSGVAEAAALLGAFPHVLILSADDEQARHDEELIAPYDPVAVETVDTGEQALELIREDPFDLVLCDERAGDMDASEFLDQLVRSDIACKPPVILLMQSPVRHTLLDVILRGVAACTRRRPTQESFARALVMVRQLELFSEVEDEMLAEAQVLAGERKYKAAVAACFELLGMEQQASRYGDPGVYEYNDRAFKALAENRLGQAIMNFRKADKILDLRRAAHQGLVDALRNLGDRDKHVLWSGKADEVQREIDRIRLTRRLFVDILQAGRPGNPFLPLGERLRDQGDYAGASRALQLAVEMDPGNSDLYAALAAALYRSGQRRASLEKTALALSLAPENPLAAKLYHSLTGQRWAVG